MAETAAQTKLKAELARTSRAQADAADPTASVWVSANAGTGKTHVLTMRVLRLLLNGTPPERILCLTYTKAAAAEMSQRVFGALAKWVTMPERDLHAALKDLIGRLPAPEEITRARTLFTRSIETPGGLKVQTIHAFCERLLQRFPLEAGVPPGFTILDDAASRALMREAIDGVLETAIGPKPGALGPALKTVIAYAVDDRFDLLLGDAVRQRAWLDAAIRMDNAADDKFAAAEELLRRGCNVRDGVDRASITAAMATVIVGETLRRYRDALAGGTKTDASLAQCVTAALAVEGGARTNALKDVFLTSTGDPRQRLMTRAISDAHPDLAEIVTRAQANYIALRDEQKALDTVTATIALCRLASAVLQAYTAAKARRAALDYDDLISKCASLLTIAHSAEWVLYKLDGGLDHVLVDESQDTSPEQWRIVEALAKEFFSGTGAREDERTLFAVGDEKQSIYSFQGAAPEMFATMGESFRELAEGAGIAWKKVPLDLSFRTVQPVLEAVDKVFADATRTPGVARDLHRVKRIGHAGLVEIWPTELPDPATPGDVWSPPDETSSKPPATRLAERIADTIKAWLDRGEMLPSENRAVRAGDIIILVRKRRPFAAPMVAALKARSIPVAGSDRITLTEQIAVQDLIALGDFLTLPEDDLALACVLKSPLFGLDDDDLLTIAHGRKGSLWSALLANKATKPLFAEAGDTLKRWRARADYTPPFEFFASLLDREGMRTKLLSRLGAEAADPIDEFLSLALRYDDGEPPSLAGFLGWLRDGTREVKRDMEHGRNEVRVMTVHGAKGLEAPIVFLPDTCTTGSAGTRGGLMSVPDFERPEEIPAPFLWQIKGSSGLAAIQGAKSAVDRAEAEERNRLLYVAMTRARDRLYVTGFENAKGRGQGCWYDLIREGFGDALSEVELADGTRVLRSACEQSSDPEAPRHSLDTAPGATPLPDWALKIARAEPQLSVPLAPSRLAPYDTDEEGEPSKPRIPPAGIAPDPPAPSPLVNDSTRFLRGTLTHALLEHMPGISPADRKRVAESFLALRGAAFSPKVRAAIIAETFKILEDKQFAALFGPQSRPEVPIVALIPRPDGRGPPLKLTGQIDRLAVTSDSVLIVDYKTNRAAPTDPSHVAEAYLYQLAAYRLGLANIYPGKTIRAALLWTEGPRIMEIPLKTLDSYASKLWQLDRGRLDALDARS